MTKPRNQDKETIELPKSIALKLQKHLDQVVKNTEEKTTPKSQTEREKTTNNPKGINQHEGVRSRHPISLRLHEKIDPIVRQAAKDAGQTNTQWIEEAIRMRLEGNTKKSSQTSPAVLDAITTSLELKRAALAREQRQENPDEGAIAKWEAEIKELEAALEG